MKPETKNKLELVMFLSLWVMFIVGVDTTDRMWLRVSYFLCACYMMYSAIGRWRKL